MSLPGFNVIAQPWLLLLLIPVGLLLLAELGARPSSALTVSTGETIQRVRTGSKMVLRRLPALLRALGLALLVVALARPLQGMRLQTERADVVDIMLIVDVSGSMQQPDFIVGRQRVDRLFVTKAAVMDFIQSRKAREKDRYGMDRVGLVAFAQYAWMQCPLTLDYGVLEREVEGLSIDTKDQKRSKTAIGSAIGLSVSRLNKSQARSKVAVLLTDGINNSGSLDPITAANVAKEFGVRIYTIGAGSAQGGHTGVQTLLGTIMQPTQDPIDEPTLRRIAEKTGGKYYRATDTETLQEAYREINELEKTEVEIGDAYDYDEGFMPWLVAGALAVGASIAARRTWFEAIP